MKEKFYATSIHPFNRKMEFWHNGEQWWQRLQKDVAPTMTAHDGQGSPSCVWLIVEENEEDKIQT